RRHTRFSRDWSSDVCSSDLFKFTAAGVSSQRLEYRRVSEAAMDYAEQCRFGQTEYGSFVLKVFCPINPLNIQAADDEQFGRSTKIGRASCREIGEQVR